jgi:phosphoribosylglycinamide formyltransferase-1
MANEGREGLRVAVVASGAGTTFASLCDAFGVCGSEVRVGLLIVSRAEAGARSLAAERGVECVVLDQRTIGPERCDEQMADPLAARGIGLVVLAGYLRKIGPLTLERFDGPIINTHPGPLPRFGGQGMYGEHVHRAVLQAGVTTSAATVHLVDPDYDTGQVIADVPVPVLPEDDIESLRDRVQQAELEGSDRQSLSRSLTGCSSLEAAAYKSVVSGVATGMMRIREDHSERELLVTTVLRREARPRTRPWS